MGSIEGQFLQFFVSAFYKIIIKADIGKNISEIFDALLMKLFKVKIEVPVADKSSVEIFLSISSIKPEYSVNIACLTQKEKRASFITICSLKLRSSRIR